MEINTITVSFMQRVSILLRNYISWVMQRSAEVINVSFNQSIYQLISLLQSKCRWDYFSFLRQRVVYKMLYNTQGKETNYSNLSLRENEICSKWKYMNS